MVNKKFVSLISLLGLLTPFVSMAQDTGYVESGLRQVGGIVQMLPPIIIGVAVVIFLWGIVKFMTAGDDTEKRASAKKTLVWGLVSLLVMVSLWGIIVVLQGIIFPDGVQTTIEYPQI